MFFYEQVPPNHITKLTKKYVFATWSNKTSSGAKPEHSIFRPNSSARNSRMQYNVSLDMTACLIRTCDLCCTFTARELKYITKMRNESALPVG